MSYREWLSKATGPVTGYRIIDHSADAEGRRQRLTYVLESENTLAAPASAGTTSEVLDLAEENGQWRIIALDLKRTPPHRPAEQGNRSLPVPGQSRPHKPAP